MSGLEGAPELIARLKRIAEEAPKEFGAALYQEALAIQKLSMGMTPVDTGALRASHQTEKPAIRGGEVSVAINVGGPSAPYALPVHERLDVHHPVGQAKFLEYAVLASKPDLAQNIAKRIDLARMAR